MAASRDETYLPPTAMPADENNTEISVVSQQFPGCTYEAALKTIARDCINPELNPQHVASSLGCSRAALYRAFAQANDTVANAIWTARLKHAENLLHCPAHATLRISEIAYRSGFTDHSTFDRMFRRMHDMTPGSMRGGCGAG